MVALLTVAFVAAGAAFAGLVPLFQNPDESTHLDRVLFQWDRPFTSPGAGLQVRDSVRDAVDTVNLSEGGALDWVRAPRRRPEYRPLGRADEPAADERCPRKPTPTCQNYQYAQPPAYYVLLAPTTPLLADRPVSQHVLALRLIGLLISSPIVALTFFTARTWFRGNETAAMTATSLIAAAGPVASAAASVNNDSLVMVAAAAAVALMTAGIRRGFTVRTAALLGAAVTVGLLSKGHFLAIAPVAGAAVLSRPVRLRRLRTTAAFAASVAPGAAFWILQLARNKGFQPPGSEIIGPASTGPWNSESFLSYAVSQIDLFIGRSWGLYGWATVEVPHSWKLSLSAAAVLLALVWLLQVTRRRMRFDQPQAILVALVPVALAAAALYASFGVYRESGSVRGLVGRYVYPGAPVLAIGAAASARAASLRPSGRVQHGPGRATVAAFIVVAQVVLMGGSFRLALKGLYRTSDLEVVFERARAVAPVAGVELWLAACGALWLASTAAAAVLARRLTPPAASPRAVASSWVGQT